MNPTNLEPGVKDPVRIPSETREISRFSLLPGLGETGPHGGKSASRIGQVHVSARPKGTFPPINDAELMLTCLAGTRILPRLPRKRGLCPTFSTPPSASMITAPRYESTAAARCVTAACLAILLLAGAWAAYGPVLDRDYLFADDYPQFAHRLGMEPCAQMGRPLLGVAFWLLPEESRSLTYYRGLRAFSIAGSLLFIGALYGSVLRRMLPRGAALAAAVGCLALPTFQVCASWSTAYPLPWACLVSLAAGTIVRTVFQRDIRGFRRILALAAALVLELAALATYQPCAMCYWLVLLPIVCDAEFVHSAARRRAAYSIAAGGFVALVVYFGLFKLSAYAGLFTPLPRAALETDLLGKLSWFVSKPLVRCLAVWGLYDWRNFGVAAALVIVAISSVGYFRRLTTNPATASSAALRVWQGTAVVSLILLAYLPVLLVAEDWASYRSMIALSTTVYVLVAAAAWQVISAVPERFRRFAVVAAVVAPVLALGSARENVTANVAELNRREFGHLLTALQTPEGSQAHEIHVVMSPFSRGRDFPCRSDEFGVLCASRPAWTAAMVRTCLRVLGRSEEVAITTAEPGGPALPRKQVLVVNMNDLKWVR
jgi:hypothetical protein